MNELREFLTNWSITVTVVLGALATIGGTVLWIKRKIINPIATRVEEKLDAINSVVQLQMTADHGKSMFDIVNQIPDLKDSIQTFNLTIGTFQETMDERGKVLEKMEVSIGDVSRRLEKIEHLQATQINDANTREDAHIAREESNDSKNS